jgi:hypothetical protein
MRQNGELEFEEDLLDDLAKQDEMAEVYVDRSCDDNEDGAAPPQAAPDEDAVAPMEDVDVEPQSPVHSKSAPADEPMVQVGPYIYCSWRAGEKMHRKHLICELKMIISSKLMTMCAFH